MTLQDAVKIIRRASEQEFIKLQRGMVKREDIRRQMRAGTFSKEEDRIRWLDGVSELINITMREAARDYNRSHTNERISLLDLIDVIATVKMRLGLPDSFTQPAPPPVETKKQLQ